VKTNYKRKSSLKRATVTASLPAYSASRRKIENISDGYSLSLLIEQARKIDCTDKTMAFHSDEDVLTWCVAMLAESPTSAALMKEAAEDGWSFGLDDFSNGGFHLDVPNRYCRLDHNSMTPLAFSRSAHFRNALIMAFVRALRDIWHEARLEGSEEEICPEDMLILERMRAADGDIIAVFAGWELRCSGHADIWRYIIGSEDGDLALVFTKFLENDPSSLFDGSVLTYAFRQWYADEQRVNLCDHETLEYLDDVHRSSGMRNPFGKNRLNGAMAEEISRLPDGNVYLGGFGNSLVCDPFYAGMKDPVNKAHLSQLMYDIEVVMVNNVPFRNEELARLIFPEDEPVTAE
jgi:hypothetical protein